MIAQDFKDKIVKIQKNEFTEYIIYKKLASFVKDEHNRRILEKISHDEQAHYEFWKRLTQQEVAPSRIKAFFYSFVSRLCGLTFGLKLMERGEERAQDAYVQLKQAVPDIEKIIQDEDVHEDYLLNLIDEDRLKYISSIVLGLNDALVELTGALAGLTFALQNTKLVALIGFITGIAASLSMAASEYLSTKQEETEKNPFKASIYTGVAYIATVLFLISPYLIFQNIFFCLSVMIVYALFVILIFTYYVSVAKGLAFKKRFLEMAGISVSVAVASFFIGFVVRAVFGIEV
ncbi:MAG: VIT1/CCC1 transporter family protein [Candidatus Omnitrophota bacterium]|nr:MAG: VIT1/CCC1 transporter family protein [Candidatus Omnitrophota bacterium]